MIRESLLTTYCVALTYQMGVDTEFRDRAYFVADCIQLNNLADELEPDANSIAYLFSMAC